MAPTAAMPPSSYSSASSSETQTALKMAHGYAMLITWGMLTASGVFSARYGRRLGWKNWRKIHRRFQSAGSFLTWPIAALSIIAVSDAKRSNYESDHGKIGIVISTLSVIQGLTGTILIGRIGFLCLGVEFPCCYRKQLQVYYRRWVIRVHIVAGYTLFLLALWSIVLGVQLATGGMDSPLGISYLVYLFLVSVLCVAFEITTWARRQRLMTLGQAGAAEAERPEKEQEGDQSGQNLEHLEQHETIKVTAEDDRLTSVGPPSDPK